MSHCYVKFIAQAKAESFGLAESAFVFRFRDMKKHIFILIALASFFNSFAFAQKKVSEMTVLCVTEMPTTSFIGLPNQGSITFKLVNSNGADFMPISHNLITSYDLTLLKERSEVLKGIGSEAVFTFPLSNCEVYEDETFRCHGESSFEGKNGLKFEAVSIGSQKLTTRSLGRVYEQTLISSYFKVNNQYYDVTMKYESNECGITTK